MWMYEKANYKRKKEKSLNFIIASLLLSVLLQVFLNLESICCFIKLYNKPRFFYFFTFFFLKWSPLVAISQLRNFSTPVISTSFGKIYMIMNGAWIAILHEVILCIQMLAIVAASRNGFFISNLIIFKLFFLGAIHRQIPPLSLILKILLLIQLSGAKSNKQKKSNKTIFWKNRY